MSKVDAGRHKKCEVCSYAVRLRMNPFMSYLQKTQFSKIQFATEISDRELLRCRAVRAENVLYVFMTGVATVFSKPRIANA